MLRLIVPRLSTESTAALISGTRRKHRILILPPTAI